MALPNVKWNQNYILTLSTHMQCLLQLLNECSSLSDLKMASFSQFKLSLKYKCRPQSIKYVALYVTQWYFEVVLDLRPLEHYGEQLHKVHLIPCIRLMG